MKARTILKYRPRRACILRLDFNTKHYQCFYNFCAGFACLTAIVAWLIEFFARLQNNVLTNEEVQNGWTSESRSQFGYSYYFVVLAFILSLVNIFIVSLVRFESWTSDQSLSSSSKRHSRATCEGVIMLY